MDTTMRLLVFGLVFLAVAGAEVLYPRRAQTLSHGKRWPHNLGLSFLDVFLVRYVAPLSLVGFAGIVGQKDWGVFASMPDVARFFLSLILLDLTIYGQHLVFHRIPWLWRLHRLHHTDTEFDVTTALRFHPLEIMISLGLKFLAVAASGAPPEAVLVFEMLLNASAMFNHGNMRLPERLDRALRVVIVTPDMHRVHHSVISREHNSNYGFNISLWDRLFGTYRAQPELGHGGMSIGLEIFRAPSEARLDRMLTQPFRTENS